MLPVPYQKLHFFREKLGLDESDLQAIAPFREIFVRAKESFADYLYDFFVHIPEAGIFLTHYEVPGSLKKAWADWFEILFQGKLDDEFLSYLWKIGIRHVEVNLDQRFSNLGFSITRQFCERVILSGIPLEKMEGVSRAVGRLLDFCILIETDAYIEAHARCDMEIIKGVADRVRNKITTIGGNVRRLKKKIHPHDPSYDIYETLISDSAVCEGMVADTKTFIEMSRRAMHLEPILLEELIRKTVGRLNMKKSAGDIRIDTALEKTAPFILGHPADMDALFFHLLQNSLEAVDPANPHIRISSATNPLLPNRMEIEIFNTGIPITLADPEKLFSPFYSTKYFGSGFGLAIAHLAVKRNYGRLDIQPVLGKGTKVLMTLPSPGQND